MRRSSSSNTAIWNSGAPTPAAIGGSRLYTTAPPPPPRCSAATNLPAFSSAAIPEKINSHRRPPRMRACSYAQPASARPLVCAICAVCDAEIHSVSSLARRHHHTPVLTLNPPGGSDFRTEKACTNPFTNDADMDDAFFPSEEVNQYLNLTELDDLDAELQPMCSERVVPFSRAMAEEQQQLQQQKHHLDASTFPLFGYSESFNNSVSVPSIKAITVPDVAAAAMNGLPVGCHQPQIQLPQFSSLDRKARVLRYKEKKKARNFEKTIRYATRKAYAEARPRIRGRFARRSDAVADAGKKLSGSATSEDGFGIVPSFS